MALSACLTAPAAAQFITRDTKATKLGDSQVQLWQAGMIVTASGGPCQGIVGTAPVPIDWPEQTVTLTEEDISPAARVSFRMVGDTVRQMVVSIPYLPSGEEARVLMTFEVRRSSQLPPSDTSIFTIPEKRKVPRDVLIYLGPSKYIESTNLKLKSQAKQIGTDEQTAWGHVEAIYDWVRTNVEHEDSPLKGAYKAMTDKNGGHEDLASLFIALCRASGIPARTVWLPGHCYPEFYLVDNDGKGHWFPCQVAGTRAFGEMPDHRPILEKGDNLRDPDNRRETKRYLPETLRGAGGSPRVKFVRELLPG